jgi:hypothetical protein
MTTLRRARQQQNDLVPERKLSLICQIRAGRVAAETDFH